MNRFKDLGLMIMTLLAVIFAVLNMYWTAIALDYRSQIDMYKTWQQEIEGNTACEVYVDELRDALWDTEQMLFECQNSCEEA